jgi:hypothetical protein
LIPTVSIFLLKVDGYAISRHPGVSRGPGVCSFLKDWILAFAGMTKNSIPDFLRVHQHQQTGTGCKSGSIPKTTIFTLFPYPP